MGLDIYLLVSMCVGLFIMRNFTMLSTAGLKDSRVIFQLIASSQPHTHKKENQFPWYEPAAHSSCTHYWKNLIGSGI